MMASAALSVSISSARSTKLGYFDIYNPFLGSTGWTAAAFLHSLQPQLSSLLSGLFAAPVVAGPQADSVRRRRCVLDVPATRPIRRRTSPCQIGSASCKERVCQYV